MYLISKCTLKPANKQFSTLKNDYEMNMTNDTVIEECNDAADMPQVQYNFRSIQDIQQLEPNSTIGL